MPEGEDIYSGIMDENGLYYRQIMSIHLLASVAYEHTDSAWSTPIRNYISAIDNFEATAARHLLTDTDYKNQLKTLLTKLNNKLTKFREENPIHINDEIGKSQDIQLTLLYGRKKLSLIMLTLDRKNVFTDKIFESVAMQTARDEVS